MEAGYKMKSCPERTFYDSTVNECLACPSNCLKCIGDDGEKCVLSNHISFIDFLNDYWVLLFLVTVSIILCAIGCKYLHKCLFKPTIIRERNGHSIDAEMKLHFAENPIANPYTYIVDYINA